jgi:hypothetical protein
LAADGLSQREIARRLGINRRTAARLVAASVAPEGMVTAAATLVRLMPVPAPFLSRSVSVIVPAMPLRLSAVPRVVVSVRVAPALRLMCRRRWR